MEIPSSVLIEKIEEKNIYFFKETSSFGISNHPHVCVKKTENEYLFFVCCTSQLDTMNRLIKYQRLDPSTIVYIKKDDINKLTRDSSYINCNQIHRCNKDEFAEYYNNGQIFSTDGLLGDAHYEQIKIGILKSNLIAEEIQDLFKKD